MAPLLTVPTAFTSLALPRVFSNTVNRRQRRRAVVGGAGDERIEYGTGSAQGRRRGLDPTKAEL